MSSTVGIEPRNSPTDAVTLQQSQPAKHWRNGTAKSTISEANLPSTGNAAPLTLLSGANPPLLGTPAPLRTPQRSQTAKRRQIGTVQSWQSDDDAIAVIDFMLDDLRSPAAERGVACAESAVLIIDFDTSVAQSAAFAG